MPTPPALVILDRPVAITRTAHADRVEVHLAYPSGSVLAHTEPVYAEDSDSDNARIRAGRVQHQLINECERLG